MLSFIVFRTVCVCFIFSGEKGWVVFQRVWRLSMVCLLIKQMSEYALGRHVWVCSLYGSVCSK